MGGYGSSRWGTTVTCLTTEGLPRLDVRALARAGGLVPGTSASITWQSGDGRIATIITSVPLDQPTSLFLEYTILTSTESWRSIREPIALAGTPCHYGGTRTWARCPGCTTQCAVLYGFGGGFRCRGCHGLAYASTREG